MPLQPFNFSFYGDLYRFYLDFTDPKQPVLCEIEMFVDGRTSYQALSWSELPSEVAQVFRETYPTCDIGNTKISIGTT